MPRRLLERAIAFDVIRDQNTSGAKTVQRGRELHLHMRVGVETIVDEYVGSAGLLEHLGQKFPCGADVQIPSVPKFPRNQITDIFLCIRTEWRKVNAME